MTELKLLKDVEMLEKKVLLRLDLNVTFSKEGNIEDDYRIRKSIPTIQYILDKGGFPIIISHHTEAKQSLAPVAQYLGNYFKVDFVSDLYRGNAFNEIGKFGGKRIYVCENLRFHKGEEANNFEFAQFLASLADIYINDAFAVSHRAHASIVTVPKLLPSCAGLLFQAEVENLSTAFEPPHPFLLILGGGKPETKFPLIKKFLSHADHIFVGGAVAHVFYQDGFGYEIGRSLYKHVDEDVRALLGNGRIMLPEEVVVETEKAGEIIAKNPKWVAAGEKIQDIGPNALPPLKKVINEAAFILWNGPVGDYTIPGFEKGSLGLMDLLAQSKAKKVVGGGDTVTLIMSVTLEDKFDFISTAGGAMLQFLAEGTLPGIEALKKVAV